MKEFSSHCIFISSLANVITCIKHHAIKSSDYIKILLLLFISSNCSFIYLWKWTSIYKATCNLSIVTDTKWQVELQQQYQTLLELQHCMYGNIYFTQSACFYLRNLYRKFSSIYQFFEKIEHNYLLQCTGLIYGSFSSILYQ